MPGRLASPPPPDPSSPKREGSRPGAIARRPVARITLSPDGVISERVRRDSLAVEEPLEIRAVHRGETHRVSVTMRTPGADFELAAGFLFAEGLIGRREDVAAIRFCVDPERDGSQRFNIVNVHLDSAAPFDPASLQRNFAATSSCGVCGKASIDAVMGPACAVPAASGSRDRVSAHVLAGLPGTLRAAQPVFDSTGGLHAAALFAVDGTLLRLREDVGRHNALDKLVGAALLAGELPLSGKIALMSGRLSFELVQKATRAGISVLAGVSAPSSLAVELAARAGLTLAGFVRDGRLNVYAGSWRIPELGEHGIPG